jgi:iron complex transport system substrate-binding protein
MPICGRIPRLFFRKAGEFLFWAIFITGLIPLQVACRPHKPESESRQASYPTRNRTDALGRIVPLPSHPGRIISLAPSVTEVLFLVGAGERVIGVSNQCDWPEQAKSKPRIGDMLNPDAERILAARPDLVIASTAGNDRAAVLKLAALKLPVFVTAPRSIDGIFETTETIGSITDCTAAGENLLRQMRTRLETIRERLSGLAPVRAFFITWFDPLLAPGQNTFETDILRQLGIDSITADFRDFYPRVSLEHVLASDPDVIITVEHTGQPLPDLSQITGWSHLRAVRQGRVYALPEIFQHPSPRFLDAAEELARKVHPERFQ